MNTYVFYIQYDDGWLDEYATCAVNKIMAYDMLTEYLNECCVNPRDVVILDVEVKDCGGGRL
jgi:hypothetical protein